MSMTGISSLLPSARCMRDPVCVSSFPHYQATDDASPLEIKTTTWWEKDFHIGKGNSVIFYHGQKKITEGKDLSISQRQNLHQIPHPSQNKLNYTSVSQ